MIRAVYNKIRETLAAEHDGLILWVPVWMSAGVAWYFHLQKEPPLWLGVSGIILSLIFTLVIARSRRRRGNPAVEQEQNEPHGWIAALTMFARNDGVTVFFYMGIIAALFFSGVALSQWRTHHIHSPALKAPMPYAYISGKIVEIDPRPKGSKILLEDVVIDKLPLDQTPAHVSVTLRSYDPGLVTGQIVILHAGLFPPPEPALPGGFDFSRYFFFRETGAVGYGIGAMDVRSLKDSGASSFDIWFAEFRHRLTESIRSYFHEPAGAVAAAFITGETSTIPDSINDDMRIAGLYHLLAVSGMNLSVVAGIAFFSLRFLLAAIPPVALRFNIKKWAAFLALIASYIYLRVSGTPVSAERAFFMVSLVFLAILLDRDPTPMRSVAFAAFCILLYEPEEVLTASFQLSFSATAALIASYEWGIQRFAKIETQGFGIRRVAFYFAAVIATSLVAWLATEPFIIYHFNQFSSYSLLSNTVAEPLVSFVLMPLIIAGVLLLPLHLAWLAFTPMQYGVDILLGIAHFVAHLPHAMWIVPSPTNAGWTVALLGAVWIYFWRMRWRWLGVIPVLAGMSTAFLYVPPDVFIGADGKHVAVRLNDGQTAMMRGKATSVLAQSWARAATELNLAEKKESSGRCDKTGCSITTRGHTIAALRDSDTTPEECRLSDVVIVSAPVSAGACTGATLLDKTALGTFGATTLWFTPHGIFMRHVRPEEGNRPWAGTGYE
jgi:competence protein ComEC